MNDTLLNCINGGFCSSPGPEAFDVANPATARLFAFAPFPSAEDVHPAAET